MSKEKKWRKITRSKYKYPTYIQLSGFKGTLVVGSSGAASNIRSETGYSVDNLKAMHTRTLWRWGWPVGMKMKEAARGGW